jgi:hypothetical protein
VLSSPDPGYDERAIFEALSQDRLAPYVAEMGTTPGSALALYVWNARMSAAFFEEIHYLEVVLRNRLHEQLTRLDLQAGGTGDWQHRREWLSDEAIEDLEKARARVERKGRTVAPGRVLTELSFGFWRYLLTSRYHRILWEPGLRFAFPNLDQAMDRRREVEAAIASVYMLRNRIAHHEPILSRDLIADHEAICMAVAWMCGETSRWVEDCARVLDLTMRRPKALASEVA